MRAFRRGCCGCDGGHRRVEADAGGPESAQRLIECGDVALLRVIGEQRQHVVAAGEHILHEAVQRTLGADFHEHARAGVVQRVKAFHELHRRRHLLAEAIEHRLGGRVGRVELAGHVGHQRDARRPIVNRRSVAFSGTAAGATIDVWNAWLTGMRDACMPRAVNASMAAVNRGRVRRR